MSGGMKGPHSVSSELDMASHMAHQLLRQRASCISDWQLKPSTGML